MNERFENGDICIVLFSDIHTKTRLINPNINHWNWDSIFTQN